MDYHKMYQVLERYGQLHVLKYFNELNTKQQEELYAQVVAIDFSKLSKNINKTTNNKFDNNDYNDIRYIDNQDDKNQASHIRNIRPIDVLTIKRIHKNINSYLKTGIGVLKDKKLGAVLLAGGMGTRLGSSKPKGMYNIGLTKELYIFEQVINNLIDMVKVNDLWIPLFIMTSKKNKEETISFFKQMNYFGYEKEFIFFFEQDMTPSFHFDGTVILDSKSSIAMSPNGNGGWFQSLVSNGLHKKMEQLGIEWLNVFSVDNVLQKICDPIFIGATLKSNCSCGAKVVKKQSPYENIGVICLEDNKPSIIEYYELEDNIRNQVNETGESVYQYGVTLNYLFQVKELYRLLDEELPLHRVERKTSYLDEGGELILPIEANSYKFETLILDMIHNHNSCLPYEVIREKEFAPIKNLVGVDSVDTARELLLLNGFVI